MKNETEMEIEAEILCEDSQGSDEGMGPFRILNNNAQNQSHFKNCCNWTLQQNAKYAAFIIKYDLFLRGKPEGKLWAVFKTMAKFLKTRNYRQCKQHHQKMCQKFNTFDKIIKNLHLSSEQFEGLFSHYLESVNQFVQSKIKQRKQLLRKRAQQVEDPQQIDRQSKIKVNQKKTCDNYSLCLTLEIKPETKIAHLSQEQELVASQQIFVKWTQRLHSVKF